MLGDDLKVVAAVYGPDGFDWAHVMGDPVARRRFRRRVGAFIADDFEMLPVQPPGGLRTVIVGLEAYLAGMRIVMEAFKKFHYTAESFVRIEGGVLVFVLLDGETIEGPHSFSGRGGAIFELEDGLIRRIREYDNRRELLDAGAITADEARGRAVPAAKLTGRPDVSR